MANAHDYFEYLTDHVDISPANSQEELNAATTIAELREKARLTLVSPASMVEGGAHDVLQKDSRYFAN